MESTSTKNVSIENLSDYVLLEIFKWLDPASVLNSTLVCSRWDRAITSSKRAMESVSLIVKKNDQPDWKKAIEEILLIERKFSKIKMESFNFEKDIQVFDVLKKHESTLSHIEITKGWIGLQSMMNTFVSMDNLQSVTVDSCFSNVFGLETFKPQPLKKLKKLKVVGSDFEVLALFSTSQISVLEIVGVPIAKHTVGRTTSDEEWYELMAEVCATEFIARQLLGKRFKSTPTKAVYLDVNAKVLLIKETSLQIFYEGSNSFRELSAKAYTLKVSVNRMLQDRIILHFLMNQANLESLTIDNCLVTKQTLSFITSGLKSLKHRRLNGKQF